MGLELRDIDFEKISRLVYDYSGIHLHDGKKELVRARLNKRLREGRYPSFADYHRHVSTGEGADELIAMIDSISTNLTSFFREEKHYRRLREVLPGLVRAAGNGLVPRLRLWSAGCSTGEEPYSLAMTLREAPEAKAADLKIVATDISSRVIETAVKGVYPEERVKPVPPALLRKYFQIGQGKWSGFYRLKPDILKIVEFRRFNLMDPFPRGEMFDVIFCRNVMIYFKKDTQALLIEKFHRHLNEGGYFFIGHSESLTGLNHRFKYVDPSIYRK